MFSKQNKSAHKGQYYHLWLILLLSSAGLGPLLRFNDFSIARLVSVCILLLFLHRAFALCRFHNLVPVLFGFLYTICLLFGAIEITLSTFLFIGYGLLAMILSVIPLNNEQITRIFYLFIIVGIVAAISAIYEYKTGYNWYTGDDIMVLYGVTRAVGLHGNSNATAGFILLGLISSSFLFFESKYSIASNIILISVLVVSSWGLFLTASRGAYIAFFLALIPIILVLEISFLKRILILGAIMFMLSNVLLLTQGRDFSFSADNSGEARLLTWGANWRQFLESPIIGNPSAQDPLDIGSHNNFIEVLSNGGLVSFIPFLYLHWIVFLAFWRNRKETLYIGWFSLIISMVGLGLTHMNLNNIILWCLIGLILNKNIPFLKHSKAIRWKGFGHVAFMVPSIPFRQISYRFLKRKNLDRDFNKS